MMIMVTKKILLLGFILVLISSCRKYLDPYPNGDYSDEDIWEYQNMVQGLVGQCYDWMPKNYNDNEGAYIDGATDNAVLTNSTYVLRRMAVGAMTTSNDAFQTYWTRDYRAIRNVNLFLKDRRGYNTRFIINNHNNDLVKNRLQGEAFALRAWFQWDLLQKFGGKGTNGELLGFPIVTEPINASDNVNLSRNSYDECVAQIISDCDSAFKYLPIAHRDYLQAPGDLAYAGGKYWGRLDGITTQAIKSMVYLTWASPRFNPLNDITRWDSAAKYAKKVIDFKLTKDAVSKGFKVTDGVTWTNPIFPGIVFGSRYNTGNDAMERMFYPGGFQGDGVIGATQELVNSFGMNNGYPIDDPANRGNYNPKDPYANREPRFYSMIFYNNEKVYQGNDPAKKLMYTFENWNEGSAGSGKDAAGTAPDNSLTNYHIKKFVYMGLDWSETKPDMQAHSKFFVRWAQMVLTFAEAANHVTKDPNALLYGLTPKAAMKYLRSRKTYDGKTPTFNVTDNYLEEVASKGETEFDNFVKNERRIETCFEGIRFYDLRRWTTDSNWQNVINTPVHGVYISQNSDLSFTYDLSREVEIRAFQSPYLPIPYQEILRMSNLIQNEGWETWN